jgi:hypothetical protein
VLKLFLLLKKYLCSTYLYKDRSVQSQALFAGPCKSCSNILPRVELAHLAPNFRHYEITALISEGWQHDQIQKITGHKSITTLAIYDHAGIEVVENKFRDMLARL